MLSTMTFYNSKGPKLTYFISGNGIFYFIVRNVIHILSTELSPSIAYLTSYSDITFFFSRKKKKLDINQSMLIICKTKINFKNHLDYHLWV